jgi:hypothetical protein
MAAFQQYRDSVAMREQAFREQNPNRLNISSLLQPGQGTPSSPPSAINPNEIPSVGALANMQAISNTQSTARQDQNRAAIKRLPQYVDAYKNYLKWRYPTRYGGGSGNASGGPALSGYDVPGLPDPLAPPKPS